MIRSPTRQRIIAWWAKDRNDGYGSREPIKMPDIEKQDRGITLNVELVGIKNLKTTHNWRLEMDVYEIDSHKVKNLMDKINKPLVMALVDE